MKRLRRLPIHYSQNFLHSRSLVKKLVRQSSIGRKDIVVEIGPGNGIITSQLVKRAKKVIAVEKDKKVYFHLINNFRKNNLTLVNRDFLKFVLPKQHYKVFANIPFIITSEIVKKLVSDNYFQEGYLVMQKEAAKKFIGMPYGVKNSMVATLLKPWFETKLFWNFSKADFNPSPGVEVVMLHIKRKDAPLIKSNLNQVFKNFIAYTYTRSKIAKLKIEEIIVLFEIFNKTSSKRQKQLVYSEGKRLLEASRNIKKIHRSRTDRNWRKFKNYS